MNDAVIHIPLTSALFALFSYTTLFAPPKTSKTYLIPVVLTIVFFTLAVEISKLSTGHNYKQDIIITYLTILSLFSAGATFSMVPEIALPWYATFYVVAVITFAADPADLHISFKKVANKNSIVLKPHADYYIFFDEKSGKVYINKGPKDAVLVLTTEEFDVLKHALDDMPPEAARWLL